MRQRGFTLVEIMVVVMIIAMATAAVALTISGSLDGARVRSASKNLVAALRATRSKAVVSREAQVLVLDVDKRAYRAAGRDWVELPKAMELGMETAASEIVDEGVGQIRFFPDGSSTGGNIELRRGEALWRIDVAWLTGEVRMNPQSNE